MTTVSPGQQITYTIVAQNNGLITATNALVSDIMPTLLTNVTWTSVATGGATDNQASGTDTINDYVTLTAGSRITYTVNGTVAANALPSTSTTNNTSSSGSVCDFGSGRDNTNIGQSTTSSCVKAEGLSFSNGSYQSSNLWQRNTTDNRGLGCSSSSQSSSYGWSWNNWSNSSSQPTKDVIRLTKNDGDQWKSLCVSSLSKSSSGCTNKGTLYWSDSANPDLDKLTTKCTVQYGDLGNGVTEGDILSSSKLSNFDCNAKYVFWVAEKNSDGSSNDCSLWKTTTCPTPTTTGSLTNTATITGPTGFTDSNLSNNSATDTDTLVATPTIKIGDRVWYDTNRNGVQDTGESGVSGVAVKLFNQAGTQISSTTTDANGLYQFTANGNSKYSVQFVQPTGFDGFTTANLGNYTADSDVVNTNGTTAQFSVGTTDNLTVDAGLIKNIGDLSITKTDGLTTVSPGQLITYTIVAQNNGLITATNALVSDIMPTNLTNVTWTSVATGGAIDNQTSGTGSINDYVTLTAGSRITYTVNGTVAANTSPSGSSCDFGSGKDNTNIGQSTTSSCVKAEGLSFSNGSYQSSNLWQRNTTDNRGLGCSSSSQSSSYGWSWNNWSNSSSQPTKDVIRLTKNDGDQWKSLCVSSLSKSSSGCTNKGTLYWSDSANPDLDKLTTKCTVQYGDLGNGVTEGDILSSSKLSNFDCNAKYVFWVAEKNSDGSSNDCSLWKTTTCPTPTTTGSLTNTATITSPTGFTDSNLSNNIATDTDTIINKGSIGDRVWLDADLDGIQDNGELGVSGVTVKLFNSTTNALLGTQVTNTSGNYLFQNLDAGNYYVQFTKPTDYSGFTSQNKGSNDAVDSDVDTLGKTGVITLSQGTNYLTNDAGLIKYNTGGSGCGKDYWNKNISSWTGCNTNQSYESVFGIDYNKDGILGNGKTCYEALNSSDSFLRETVGAYLNSCSLGSSYKYTKDQVIGLTQQACGGTYDLSNLTDDKTQVQQLFATQCFN